MQKGLATASHKQGNSTIYTIELGEGCYLWLRCLKLQEPTFLVDTFLAMLH